MSTEQDELTGTIIGAAQRVLYELKPGLDEKKQFQFYMASYDIDSFRRFVFDSRFLDVFDIDDEMVEKIKNDDIELIKFGVKYIKYVMMLEESLKVKDEHLKEKDKKQETE